MKLPLLSASALVLGLWISPAQAEDSVVAAALAKSAIKLNEDGKTEKARGLCYKSLANDENCADALLEMGKILEQDGNHGAAADFYVRAIRVLGKDEAANKAKIADAKNRLTKLNPYANQLNGIMGDYATELGAAVKKNNDSLTKDETYELNQSIRLEKYVGAEKLPKFERGESLQTEQPGKTADSRTSSRRSFDEDTPAKNDIPLEVEKALKAPNSGWGKITGTWKKKAENVYEVTDGHLEADKLSGAVQVTVQAGGKGSVDVFVRNGKQRYYSSSSSYSSSDYSYSSGYGYRVKPSTVSIFTPYNGFGNEYYPYKEKDFPIAGGKTNVVITIDGSKMEYLINGARVKSASYPIVNEGNFVINVTGTMTIELPQAAGR